jgi:N-acetyl-anhydromuramyl-L-alanine amidase AmpD
MPTPPLTDQQKNAFEMLKEKIPADLVPGYNVSSGDDVAPQTAWLKAMKRWSKDLGTNAFAYYNYIGRGKKLKRLRRRPTKVMSADGFPPWVTVAYAFPPPGAFYTPGNPRPVKHIILHSFGHGWMAAYVKGKGFRGWMNSKKKKRGVQVHELDGKTVYVPKGSDENLSHPQKFTAGLSNCLNSAMKASAHFFIDRTGNVMIIGDCNDSFFTSNGLDRYGVGIELEEAFYVEEHPTKTTAKFRAGGTPPGTAGNVMYAAYSPLQLLTLSIICRKLETAFPEIKQRNLEFKRQARNYKSPPGYSMHDFAKGSKHFDVSPQFLEEETWHRFFDLVDTHTHITSTNVWKPRQKYKSSGTGEDLIRAPLSAEVTNNFTKLLLGPSHDTGVAIARSSMASDVEKSASNEEAGNRAVQESQKVLQEAANTYNMTQQAENPPVSRVSKNIAIAQEIQAQTSDYW